MSDVHARQGGFVVGFPGRHHPDASAPLARSGTDSGFTPGDLIARLERAFGGGAEAPRHFHPADGTGDPAHRHDALDPDAWPAAHLDPVEEARQAGYDAGFAAATEQAAEQSLRDSTLLTALADALREGSAIDRDALARRLRETVLALVRRMVGETGVSADLLAARIAAATDLLADASESAMLHLHPDDVALVEGVLPKTVFAIGDGAIARGSFLLESASTVVEDGPELWLEQAAAAIDRAAIPAAPPSPTPTQTAPD